MTEIVRLLQLDGKIPNIALMKLAAWHKARGDNVHYVTGARCAERGPDEPHYDRVYGSAIFKFSAPLIARFKAEFPDAIVGGTGSSLQNAASVQGCERGGTASRVVWIASHPIGKGWAVIDRAAADFGRVFG